MQQICPAALARYARAEQRAGYARNDQRCLMFAKHVWRCVRLYGYTGNPYPAYGQLVIFR